MNPRDIEAVALSVRTLSMDAVEKAASGHPGLPLGCAELGALLFCEILNHYPGDPHWMNRDRFVLSAGHGSMLLYALLFLTGYAITLEDIKAFRQLGSRTPGHPEYGVTPGIETTTGPLGQGVGNAVGLAIAERMLAERFNTEEHAIIDHYTYVLAGDGDMMEGVSSEAASLAGHLGLGKLIVFYDSNAITIEGSTELAFSEDVPKRFAAYNWHTLVGSAYDLESMLSMVAEAKSVYDKPSLLVLESVIAQGAPTMAGSHKAHGAPLGQEEVRNAKRALGVPQDSSFFVSSDATRYLNDKRKTWEQHYERWQTRFHDWQASNPKHGADWHDFFGNTSNRVAALNWPEFAVGEKIATRSASGTVLNNIASQLENVVGGSADLAPSNSTELSGKGDFSRSNPGGRNFHFGVREHAMGSLTNGICLHGGLRPFCATFTVFSDYMRPPIRLAAMMGLPAIYVFTHDSIFVGEDGPTHQPIEQIASLRTIPNLVNLRPGDAQETAVAWRMALSRTDGPTSLLLTRQKIEVYTKEDSLWKENLAKGAYIVRYGGQKPDCVVVATGSEVQLATAVADGIQGIGVRVISMVSRELFVLQDEEYRCTLLPEGVRRIIIEAGVGFGWDTFTRGNDRIISIESFGESGKGDKVATHLGISAANLLAAIQMQDQT